MKQSTITTDLTHLFTLGQKVQIRNEDFDVVNGPRFDDGIVTNITTDLLTVFITDLEINLYFDADMLDLVYPIYNF